jgi:hypothetical protein
MPELSLSMECPKIADGAANSPKAQSIPLNLKKARIPDGSCRAFLLAILGTLFALDFRLGLE